jgi:type II secretory pathway component GspD/PulD (secretin)
MRAPFLFASFALAGLLAPATADPGRSAPSSPHDAQVKIEVRFISVAEDFFDRIGVDLSRGGEKVETIEKSEEGGKLLNLDPTTNAGGAVFLDNKQVHKFLQAIEGDIRSNILQAPQMIVSDGKVSNFRSIDQHRFVTGIKAIRQGENIVFCPKNETISTGLKLSIRPTIRADRRAIAVNMKSTLTSLDSDKVPLFPIVLPATSSAEQSAPVTQYIQQPRINTLAMREAFIIPDGGAVVVGGWKRVSEGRCEYGPPVLSKIPYLSRLFTNVGYSRSTENILIMVTATIVCGE